MKIYKFENTSMTILVTGCAGFIGSNFVHTWLSSSSETVVNLDKLTYAGNLANLDALQGDKRHIFVQGDIGDRALVAKLLAEHKPRAVLNFAAESHVDRSIHGPGDFIETNIVGTFNLLESVRAYWQELPEPEKAAFRFCMCRPTRCTAHSAQRMLRLPKPKTTSLIAPTLPARPPATT
jgi:dTDP-glucose 4,6-dehydratase